MFSKVIKCLEKLDIQINTKYSKTSRLQKVIKYKKIEQSQKYLNSSIEIKNFQIIENINR